MIRPDQVSPPGVNSIKLFYSPGHLYWAFPFSKGLLDKHTSLFAQSVSDEDKKVLILQTPGVNSIKLFSFIADDEAK
jgi:hypothetical protein